jgi:FkbM family methyltransferase
MFHLKRRVFELFGSGRYSRQGHNNLDLKLARYLGKRNGFFIEAGANDGVSFSNTYYLERILGWRGILVEGIPHLAERARRQRPRSRVFQCALVSADQEGTEVEMIYGNLMSVVVGAMGSPEADREHIRKAAEHDPESGRFRVTVKGRTLSSLIDEAGAPQVDFLSLDVEGFEGPVLRGLDFQRHRPEYICVEARRRPEIEGLLAPCYDLVEQLTEMDLLFRSKARDGA